MVLFSKEMNFSITKEHSQKNTWNYFIFNNMQRLYLTTTLNNKFCVFFLLLEKIEILNNLMEDLKVTCEKGSERDIIPQFDFPAK